MHNRERQREGKEERKEEKKAGGEEGGNAFMQEIFVEHLLYTSLCSMIRTDRVPALKELFFQKQTKKCKEVQEQINNCVRKFFK